MYKYTGFAEYIQLNYAEELQDSIAAFLKETELSKPEYSDYNQVYINELTVRRIVFTKSRKDHVEFTLSLYAKYTYLDVFDISVFKVSDAIFITKMQGSFRGGFKGMDDETALADGEQPERLSNGLVPIISNETMDIYATKFLKEFCPEALETPMKLPVMKMLKDKGIRVYYAPLEDNVFGKTYFGEDTAVVYEGGLPLVSTPKEIDVKPGTILINLKKHLDYPEGVYNNTIIHEAVHWYFHRNYFELQRLLDAEKTHVACYKGETAILSTDIQWMEWQARTLAPKILMPKKMALKKYEEIKAEIEATLKDTDDISAMFAVRKKIVSKFANFFGVSMSSAKIRLNELGIPGYDGIGNYVDGAEVKPFYYRAASLKKHQTYVVGAEDFYQLITTNPQISRAIISEKLIYTNKLLVVNHPKYINAKTYEMTKYAREHVDECCLSFDIETFTIDKQGNIIGCASFLCNNSDRTKYKKLTPNPEAVGQLLSQASNSASHYEAHKAKLPATFHETLDYHYQSSKKNYELHTIEDFAYEADMSDRQLRRYLNGEVIPDRIVVLKLALALKLSAPYILDLLRKADCEPTLISGDNTILLTIIYGYQRIGLDEVYRQLELSGKGYILQLTDERIKSIVG